MRNLRRIALAFSLSCVHGFAAGSVIRFAASTANSPPLAKFRGDVLEAGILKELGEAIADKLHRKAHFVPLSRKRLEKALADGMVDGVCYALPAWYGVSANWSQPLIPNESVLVAGPNIPAPRALPDVAGEEFGLVRGYRYPELDAVYGRNYARDDAPSIASNIQKLLAGRQHYAVIDRLSLNYYVQSNPALRTCATLSIATFRARCAFSHVSKIPFGEIDSAIQQLVKEGVVAGILARYH